jgi:hypothetical protein
MNEKQYQELREKIKPEILKIKYQKFRDAIEIRLADILIAVPHLKPTSNDNIIGGQAESKGNTNFIQTIAKYNLHHDSLDAQSDEFKEWLYQIICK